MNEKADDVDDEEPLPKQRTKVESWVEDIAEPTPAAAPVTTAAEATAAAVSNDQDMRESQTTTEPPSELSTPPKESAGLPCQTEKARKKARLMLKLEDIKAERAEIKLKMQLMELEDDDGA